jgi:glycosyltransferase involved in cell wall biosynthesis
MKIVLAAVSSTEHLSGVTRHAANLTRCLLTRPEVSAVHLIVARWQHASLREAVACSDPRLHIHSVSIGRSMFARNHWYYADLPSIAAQLKADVVHLAYPAPMHRRAFHCPTVVTLHDLYPYDIPENFGLPKVLFHRIVLWQCLRAADGIACVSDSTLQRLRLLASQPVAEKAARIYNCVEPAPLMPSRTPLPHWKGEPFFLCVAQHRRNKNIVLTMGIFQRLLRRGEIAPETRLVIVGVTGPETTGIYRFLRDENLSEKVVLLSGITNAELQWLYRNCEVLLAPSIVEGFGLPVAEGLLAGCRIVCSDIPAFRELGSYDNCRYVALGPSAEEDFAEAIGVLREEPRGKPADLSQLSPPVIAEECIRLYRGLLVSGAGSSRSVRRPTPAQKDRASISPLLKGRDRENGIRHLL